MITKILLIAGALLAVLLVVIALQPSTYHIERSLQIAASPATIFPHVNDLKKAHAWSPWMQIEPSATVSFDGNDSGVGASSSWVGQRLGEGRQTIVESRANEQVRLRLEFIKPFAATCAADFTLVPVEGGTRVTWSMAGKNNVLAKAFSLIVSQEMMIGEPFEQGLANLRRVVETPASGGSTVAISR